MKYEFPQQRVRQYARDHLSIQDGVCVYCDEPLTENTLTADHIIPRSKGGGNWRGNIAAACERCNQAKGSMGAMEFLAFMRSIPENHPRKIHLMMANYRLRINQRVALAERRIRRAVT